MNAPNLPAHLQGLSSRGLAERASSFIGTAMPPHISIQGNTFTLIDASNNEHPLGPTMQACVVDVSDVKCKKYFDKEWEPNSNDPPTCWSANGVAPSREAVEPQARTCAECEWNKRGSKVSKISGVAIKACRDEVWLAVLLPKFPDMLFQLVITPGSFDTWGGFLNKFKQTPGVDLVHVLVQFSFVPKTNGVIDFQAVSYIDEATAAGVGKALASKATDVLVGRNDQPRQLPAPAAQPALAAPEAQQGQQPAPFVPAAAPTAAFPSTAMASQPTQTVAVATPAASPSEQQPARRRRRTAAEMAAAQQPNGAGQPAAAPAVAPFMPQAQNPQNPQPAFGMAAGAAPSAELAATLDNLFGPKK